MSVQGPRPLCEFRARGYHAQDSLQARTGCRMKRVVVIGGGVIGLCAAFSLQRRGHEVTVVESHTGSHGASVVNAGWVCPAFSDPVPSPGLIQTSMKWMLRSDSPLYIKPSLDADFLRWLVSFWRKCNDRSFAHGLEALGTLNQQTFAFYDALSSAGVAFERHQAGILFVFHSLAKMEHELVALEPYANLGIAPPTVYRGAELHDLEPALSPSISGGFWHAGERHIRPDTLTTGLTRWLVERGVEFRFETQAIDFAHAGGNVSAVETTGGEIETDAVVIAAGVWSGELSRRVGVKLPLQGGKGYCLDYSPPPVELGRPVDFAEDRFACTPMDGMIRLAGTMEFSGINDTVRPERVAAIASAASRGFTGWPAGVERAKVDQGLRPMTPDGLPLIGLLPGFSNLAVATGHATLGLTLAPSTGEEIAELIGTGRASDLLAPFNPARFQS